MKKYSTYYNKISDSHKWEIHRILRFQAMNNPNKISIKFVEDKSHWTYEYLYSEALRYAGILRKLGIKKNDVVCLFIDDTKEFTRIFLAVHFLGAIFAPINTGLKGQVLFHQLMISKAKYLITEKCNFDICYSIANKISQLENHVFSVEDLKEKKDESFTTLDVNEIKYNELTCIMFTSGTTGPSKGVMMPNAHCVLFGIGTVDNYKLEANDVIYICLPLFHANGLFMQLLASFIAGITSVIRKKFSASNWLNDIILNNVTHTNVLGTIASFIVSTQVSKNDTQHQLKLVAGAPMPVTAEKILLNRFKIPVVIPHYGMTEVNMPIYGIPHDTNTGSCGSVYKKYFDVEIRNSGNDEICNTGQVGEIMVRPKIPFGFMSGYIGMPEKTLESWRNFWFHTGDAGYLRDDNKVVFVDRIKDCIRRKGENISSYEVEQAFLKITEVVEAAAYPVPFSENEKLEDEVMVSLIIEEKSKFMYEKWRMQAKKNLANFALPRYINVVKELPKTGTGKIRKNILKEIGVTKNTWDFEKNEKK